MTPASASPTVSRLLAWRLRLPFLDLTHSFVPRQNLVFPRVPLEHRSPAFKLLVTPPGLGFEILSLRSFARRPGKHVWRDQVLPFANSLRVVRVNRSRIVRGSPPIEHILCFFFAFFGAIAQRATDDNFALLVCSCLEFFLKAYFAHGSSGCRLAFTSRSCFLTLGLLLSFRFR